jgi:serine phosphatase RsbU (regulator of sigma subunit)/Tfp pilus assembly protein PilF
MKFLNLVFYFLFASSFSTFSQLNAVEISYIDSLKAVIESDVNDTLKIDAYIKWDNMIYFFDPNLDWEINEKIESLCQETLKNSSELKFKEKNYYLYKLSYAYNNLGIISVEQGDPTNGLKYYEKSTRIRKELNFKEGLASTHLNMGNAQLNLGNFSLALNNYYSALKWYNDILKAPKDSSQYKSTKSGMADTYNGIGSVYQAQKDYEQALENYRNALHLHQENNYSRGIGASYNNIGIVYADQNNNEKALKYLLLSRDIKEANGNERGLANISINLGSIYDQQEDYEAAFKEFRNALEIHERTNNNNIGLMNTYLAIGNTSYKTKKYADAKKYLELGLAISEVSLDKQHLRDFHLLISKLSKDQKQYKNAYDHLTLHYQYRDSINNEEETKLIIQQQLQYNYDMKAVQDSVNYVKQQEINDIEIERTNAELKSKKIQQYALYGGLILVILFLIVLFKRLKLSQRQKQIIEEQNNVVTAKNKEILDSITYAKRIQTAILPSDSEVEKNLPNSFIYYLPKDIVAGDFYWLEKVEDTILFAAADCTGHGVPGAMVSVICNGALNRSIREYNKRDPGEILDKTREIVISEFEKSDEDVKDGMDIALCALNGDILSYAGAHNPLWIVRKGSETIQEIKATKQPIGKSDFERPYETHSIELNSGDSFYIFSDGYSDQFGGEKGKKFKAASLKKLILSIQNQPLETQKKLLHQQHISWKGELEQLDDICIIGVQIS